MWYPLYITRFKDDNQGDWTVEVQDQGTQTLAPVEITAGDAPLTWMCDGSGSQTECILGATGSLGLNISDQEMLAHFVPGKLLPDAALSRRVVAKRNGAVVWQGFVQPQTFNQAWEAPPFDINLALMDMVAALKYVYLDANESAKNILDMLYSAYQKTGGEKMRRDFMRTNVRAYNGRNDIYVGHPDWGTGTLYPEFWNSDPDKKVSYEEVLDILLSPHARLTQTGETWFVGRDDITSTRLYRPADAGGGQLAPNETNAPTTDISHKVAGSRNTQAQLPPPSKITSEYSPDGGTINVSGDTLFKLSSEMIVGDGTSSVVDVQGEQGATLRYIFLTDIKGNFRRTSKIHHYTLDWGGTPGSNQWRENGNIAPGWAQVLESDAVTAWGNPNFKLHKELVFCTRREVVSTTPTSLHNRWNEDYIEVQTPVYVTPGTNMLQVKAEAFGMDLITKDGAALAIFYGEKPGRLDKYLQATPEEWNTYNPGNILQPRFWTPINLTDGIQFHLPNGKNTGYITIMVTPGVTNETESYGDNYTVAYTTLALSYVPENVNPRKPLQWNRDAVDIKKQELAGGVDEVTMTFRTLAGVTPDASTMFAPRRGFDDSIHYVGSPREMVDIDAVQVTQSDGIPGVTRFSLFQFNSAIYYPAAVGMNAKDNTVRLKLIRTL